MGITVCLAGCTGSDGDTSAAQGAPVEPETTGEPLAESAPVEAAEPLAPNAPAFASLYPGASLLNPPVLATGQDGPGGMAEFTTEASPEQVVDHYRQLADNNGLKPVMSMNQGNARAFAALNESGAEVQVVATAEPDTVTSVQLTWKSGN